VDDVVSSLVECLGAHWNVSGVISEYEPGSLSRAWRVDTSAGPVVAKLARNTLAHFALGLRISEVVDAAGITSGKPIRTIDGEVAVTTDYGSLAVLEHVPGGPRASRTSTLRFWVDSSVASTSRSPVSIGTAAGRLTTWMLTHAPVSFRVSRPG
jgi:Ser/Thr protein kinase RdoA (MazF antagonist)